MHNMLIRPSEEELLEFGTPDFTIVNAGEFPANKYTESMSSQTTVSISFKRAEMVILGTQYAGEMKKGIFSVMHYLMPKLNVLSLHASCNVGKNAEDVTLFFGLSGTGKTTLSADIHRHLIGDDEHCWTEKGIFNIEGGCYAKCIDLSHSKEPEIYEAIRYGSVLENVVLDTHTREIEFDNRSITENTRVAYPIEYIPNSRIPCIVGHPKNLVMLTCDAFGILPPVSKLTSAQAMYHFICGYTAKIPGTEMGVTDPVPNFSACFGQPFIVYHPAKYAHMLAEKIHAHEADAWLINTGWTGGKYGVGRRCPLQYTRAILDAIHSGELTKAEYEVTPIFNLRVPKQCTNVPDEILHPEKAWLAGNGRTYDEAVKELAVLFQQNFAKYQSETSPDVIAAGPIL